MFFKCSNSGNNFHSPFLRKFLLKDEIYVTKFNGETIPKVLAMSNKFTQL